MENIDCKFKCFFVYFKINEYSYKIKIFVSVTLAILADTWVTLWSIVYGKLTLVVLSLS